jgi:hypothetical protein
MTLLDADLERSLLNIFLSEQAARNSQQADTQIVP